ncbi:hypothetical protein BKA62DRAFT_4478 [Auriculariales sp. MPI-PUGE-AT-0066]|nr:hypothetical protein BKA62DRAFT_4478 [Auriculariales sp. MPI-PUGE-AT-0066]
MAGDDSYDGTRSTAFRTVTFLILILGGQATLAPVTLTFIFAKSIVRQPSLIYFCLSWVMFSIFACLLLYSGNLDKSTVPEALCHVQLSGMLGCYILAGVSALCLSLQVYLATPNGDRPHRGKRFEPVLAYLPPIAWVGHQLAYIIIHFTRHGGIQVERRDQICVIKKPHSLTRNTQLAAAAAAALSLIVTIVMIVKAVGFLRAQSISFWKHLTSRRRSGSTGVWLRILARLCTFELYCFIMVLIVLLMVVQHHSSPVRQTMDFIVDTVPLVTFLVFGTSPDVLVAWGLRKPASERSTITSWSTSSKRTTIPPPPPPKDYILTPKGWTDSPLSTPPATARGSWQTVKLFAEQTRRDPTLNSNSAAASLHTMDSVEPLQQVRELRYDPQWGLSRPRNNSSAERAVRISFDRHPYRQGSLPHDHNSYHYDNSKTHT